MAPWITLCSIQGTLAKRPRPKSPREKPKARKHDMKVRDAVRLLENDGWVQVAQKGSHRQFKHPTKPGKVTVPGKMSDDLPIGTRKSIFRQAGLEEQA